MIFLVESIKLVISFLPTPVQVVILAIIAILLLILIFRIIRMVLDAIPFL